jgi:hypothetical protein
MAEGQSQIFEKLDPVLTRYWMADDKGTARQELNKLTVDHVMPVIERYLKHHYSTYRKSNRESEWEDEREGLLHATLVQVLTELPTEREKRRIIPSFRSWVAFRADQTWRRYWQEQLGIRPLKLALVYLCASRPKEFGRWKLPGVGQVCGLAEWVGGVPDDKHSNIHLIMLLKEDWEVCASAHATIGGQALYELLIRFFHKVESPVLERHLLSALRQVQEWFSPLPKRTDVFIDGNDEEFLLENVGDEDQPDVPLMADRDIDLQNDVTNLFLLWDRIRCVLTLLERRVLLLGLKSIDASGATVRRQDAIGTWAASTSALNDWMRLGISVDEIINVLEFDDSEWINIWPFLPLNDRDIARLVGRPMRSITKVRSKARENLLGQISASYTETLAIRGLLPRLKDWIAE